MKTKTLNSYKLKMSVLYLNDILAGYLSLGLSLGLDYCKIFWELIIYPLKVPWFPCFDFQDLLFICEV